MEFFETRPFNSSKVVTVVEASEVQYDGVPHFALKVEDSDKKTSSLWIDCGYVDHAIGAGSPADLIGKKINMTSISSKRVTFVQNEG